MIKVSGITKEYHVGTLTTKALDDVSLELRDNEFVAVLGPSGSGKTTLLNIIGGLDHYDDGDLIINGRSTKHYRDRDWDTYRNHTIGFVFQSYNLIPHQSVLSNVELALTISGISRRERRKRALAALEAVGLGSRARNKPGQLSGGQMQRVAIARALVNSPDIILADEPTGALDTKTSVQVMELLREVARDRLVVMVTHNPELADEYANRIVQLRDGKIVSDSNPVGSDAQEPAVPDEKKGRAHMGFFTALSLSFHNLLTKKGRTILTAFAGSIGIVGIALILSISQGFQNYIDKIQEDTLAEYPLTLTAETSDMTSMLLSFIPDPDAPEPEAGTVVERQLLTSTFSSIASNDLRSFKHYIDTHEEEIFENVSGIKYSYAVNPLIYAVDETDKVVKLNPSDAMGSAFSSSVTSLLTSYSSLTSIYTEMTEDREMRDANYEVLTGRMPEAFDELAIVLSGPDTIPDLLVYGLGLRNTSELREMLATFMSGKEPEIRNEPRTFTYEELMNIDLRLIDAGALYKYNSKYDIYEDYSDDGAYMQKLFDEATPLRIVGILTPSGDGMGGRRSGGVLYTKALTDHVLAAASESPIVKKQLANEKIDVFSGKEFGEDDESSRNKIDFEDMISIDEDKLKQAFEVKVSAGDFSVKMPDSDEIQKVVMDAAVNYAGQIAAGPNVTSMTAILTSLNQAILASTISGYESMAAREGMLSLAGTEQAASMITVDAYKTAAAALGEADPSMAALSGLTSLIGDADFENLVAGLKESFNYYYGQIRNTDYGYIPEMQLIPYAKDEADPSKPVSIYGTEYDGTVLRSDALLTQALTCPKANEKNAAAVSNVMNTYTTYMIAGAISRSLSAVMTPLTESLSGLSELFGGGTQELFSIDTDKFAEAFEFDMSEEELSRLMSTILSGTEEKSAEKNLVSLGYQDKEDPTMISLFFKSFASKEAFIAFLDDYNDTAEEKYRITYTDITGLLMNSVSTIVDAVSYVLIAFVSVSLVVSSIMIAVITLISVMERTKEIGILRAMGASRRSVASIFNAETFIIGFMSGVLGIGITMSFIPVINAILFNLTGNDDIQAILPTKYALILIGISVLLTVFSGLIPSGKASKNDPVISLRSE